MTDNDTPRRAEEEAAAWYARLNAEDDPAEQRRFAAWLAASDANARAWARLERTAALLAQAGRRPALAALRADARRMGASPSAMSMPPLPPAALVPSAPPRRHGRLALASLALALGIGGALFWPHARTGEESAAARVTTRYATAVGERRTIGLPDGSQVTLDTDSAISLPQWGTKADGRRLVTLERGRPCSQ